MSNQKASKAIKIDRLIINIVPLIISVLSFFIINFLCKKLLFVISEEDGIDNYKTMLGIWGTLLGFLIMAVSILLTLTEGKLITMLKTTGHYKTILLAYITCCLHLLSAIVFAVICIFCQIWNMKLFAVLCAVSIDTMLMVGICLFFLFTIVINTSKY